MCCVSTSGQVKWQMVDGVRNLASSESRPGRHGVVVGIKTREFEDLAGQCLESPSDHEVTTVFSSMRCVLVSPINSIKKIRLCESTCPWIRVADGVISCGHAARTVWVGLLSVLSMCTTNSQSPESLSDISGGQVLFDLGCDTLVGDASLKNTSPLAMGRCTGGALGPRHHNLQPKAFQIC
jgi:hypothetical protein